MSEFGLSLAGRLIRQPAEWTKFVDTYFECRPLQPRLKGVLLDSPVNVGYTQSGNIYVIFFDSEERKCWFDAHCLEEITLAFREFLSFDAVTLRTSVLSLG